MKTYSRLIACPCCDSVYQRRRLNSGEEARCVRCAARLYCADPAALERWLALTFTAGIASAIATCYPVLEVAFHGAQRSVTLWQTATALASGATLPLGVGTVLLLIVVPFMQIALFGWVVFFARIGRPAPGFILAMKLLLFLRPWNMVGVGLLGFLVAGIKLAGWLQVAPGPGCWALALLMLLLTIISRRNIDTLWTCSAPPAGAPVVDHG